MIEKKKCGCPVGYKCCCFDDHDQARDELKGEDCLAEMRKNRTNFLRGKACVYGEEHYGMDI